VQITTTWTDSKGVAQRLDLNSLIAWDDPGAQAKVGTNGSPPLITPTASRGGNGTIDPNLSTANPDGSRTYTDTTTKVTYLTNSVGTVLLQLKPKNGVAQLFTTISGRILFDQNAGTTLSQLEQRPRAPVERGRVHLQQRQQQQQPGGGLGRQQRPTSTSPTPATSVRAGTATSV